MGWGLDPEARAASRSPGFELGRVVTLLPTAQLRPHQRSYDFEGNFKVVFKPGCHLKTDGVLPDHHAKQHEWLENGLPNHVAASSCGSYSFKSIMQARGLHDLTLIGMV